MTTEIKNENTEQTEKAIIKNELQKMHQKLKIKDNSIVELNTVFNYIPIFIN